MKIFKSHFWQTKSQRNGVLFLVLLIVILQVIYFYVDFSSEEIIETDTEEVLFIEKQIDSLRLLEIEDRKPKKYPFNPNYITDYKGYQLGMSLSELDRLHLYRKQNKFINSVKEFQRITKVSDSLLLEISPYFKFPVWGNKKQENYKRSLDASLTKDKGKIITDKTSVSTNDINFATAEDFATIRGIGNVLSSRIVKYRNRLQGFNYAVQLEEVWGIEGKMIKELLSVFKIIEKPIIQKININTASFKEVLKTPYVDYDLCKEIFNYRDEVAELQNILELKNIEGFPLDKYDRIVLYLEAK